MDTETKQTPAQRAADKAVQRELSKIQSRVPELRTAIKLARVAYGFDDLSDDVVRTALVSALTSVA